MLTLLAHTTFSTHICNTRSHYFKKTIVSERLIVSGRYTIEVKHGDFQWTIHRRYKHFQVTSRTRMKNISLNLFTHVLVLFRL